MPRFKRKLVELRRWMRTSPQDLSGRDRTVRWWLDLSRHCTSELQRDRASQMAAALTYHTLFSLMPTLVLSLVILHSFVGAEDMARFKEGIVNWTLQPLQQEQILFQSPVAVDIPPEVGNRRHEFEQVRQTLGESIQSVIDKLETVDFRGIGVMGVLIFIYGATGLLSTIERSFNTIYSADQGRPLYVRLPIYYTIISLGPVVILSGQVLQRRLIQLIQGEQWTGPLLGVLAVITPLLAAWLVLSTTYRLLPNTRVSLRAAGVGGFAAAVLWLIGLQLFTIYVQNAAVSTLYGALALIPLFLFWVWLTWLIVLFGLELAYALQAMREGRFAYRLYHQGDEVVIDRALLLPVATSIAESFRRGDVATVADLSRHLRLPPFAVLRLAQPLVKAGIIHEAQDGRYRGYTLARPAEQIEAAHVLALGRNMMKVGDAHPGEPSWTLLNDIYQEVQAGVAGTTLADLCRPLPAS